MMFGLLHTNETAPRSIELRSTATIGRDADNDIVLDDELVSRCHVLLLVRPEGAALIDLESSNGTYINDLPAPPDEQVQLADGDIIRIGTTLLRYEAPERAFSRVLDRVARPSSRRAGAAAPRRLAWYAS